MIVYRAGDRFVTEHDGITSYHCFSAGPHYDPDRVAFGPLVGVDEHHVAPGAGFDWHAHRGVTIVSWVLDGSLRHEDAAGPRLVTPGELFVQHAGDGLRHREWNASDSVALRFVQTTVLAATATKACTVHTAIDIERMTVRVGDQFPDSGPAFVLVLVGDWAIANAARLSVGDFAVFPREPIPLSRAKAPDAQVLVVGL